jgi:hypothetical protein
MRSSEDARELAGVLVEDRDRAVEVVERDDDDVVERRGRRAEGERHAVRGMIGRRPRWQATAPG